MKRLDSVKVILIALGLFIIVMLFFASQRQPEEERPEGEQEIEQSTREEQLRRENARPRSKPLSEEEKARLRRENM